MGKMKELFMQLREAEAINDNHLDDNYNSWLQAHEPLSAQPNKSNNNGINNNGHQLHQNKGLDKRR